MGSRFLRNPRDLLERWAETPDHSRSAVDDPVLEGRGLDRGRLELEGPPQSGRRPERRDERLQDREDAVKAALVRLSRDVSSRGMRVGARGGTTPNRHKSGVPSNRGFRTAVNDPAY